MPHAILRQWLVLEMLPRPPRRIDTASIEARLRDRGIDVHRRTIQRDLLKLAEVFPIVADERAKPYGWRWSDDAELAGRLPPGSVATAIARIDVSLRIRRGALSTLVERLAARGPRLVNEEGDDGIVSVELAIEDSARSRRILLGHGDEVEVLAPPNLRREIADRARRALAKHEGGA